MSHSTIIEVALPVPIATGFDYLCPALPVPKVGCRVKVPFRQGTKIGIVIGYKTHSPHRSLKSVLEVLDRSPIISPAIFTLCQWASDYYHYPLGEVLFAALPTALRQGKPAIAKTIERWQIASAPPKTPSGKKQTLCLQRLQQGAQTTATLREAGISSTVLQNLAEKGWIEAVHEQRSYASTVLPEDDTILSELNEEQQTAVHRVIEQSEHYHGFLLHGITGSGKTEVYLHLIKHCLAQQKQVLLLIPEIGLTPQTVSRFQQSFIRLGVYHSGLTEAEKQQHWLAASDGRIQLLIGTRSAIFAPLPNLGMILVDEEHEPSYKQQERFRYSARDLATVRAKKANVPIVFGSATPSSETFANVQQQRFECLSLTKRAGNALPPTFEIIDVRGQSLQGGLSTALIQRIKHTLAQAQQVLLYLNRRGFAPLYLCHQCGWSGECSRCSTHLTYHQEANRLICHHCNYSMVRPTHCPSCQSDQLKSVGVGTEQLESSLQSLFSQYPIYRIDRDTTKQKGSLDNLLTTIQQGEPCLLLGTQMIAKGHHFPKVTLVGILGADQGLYSQDYRAMERLGQLLVQVAGRAGRAAEPGHVMIQTHHPEHPLLHRLLSSPYGAFMQALLEERQLASLPPYHHMALIESQSHSAAEAEKLLQTIKQQRHADTVDLFGPIPAIIEKKAGIYRYQLLAQSPQRRPLHQFLKSIGQPAFQKTLSAKARWLIDVDPIDML